MIRESRLRVIRDGLALLFVLAVCALALMLWGMK